jgi:hypothetical protein
MKRQLALAAGVVLLSACGQVRVTNVSWPVDPGRLAFFIGKWSVEGEMKGGNAYGAPAGRYAYTEKYEWRPGEFVVKLTRSGTGPGADVRHDLLLGYEITRRQYSLIGSDLTTGALVSGSGTNDGDTWTFVTLGNLGAGRYFHERCAITVTSERTFTERCESSPDTRTWSPSFEAKATRS